MDSSRAFNKNTTMTENARLSSRSKQSPVAREERPVASFTPAVRFKLDLARSPTTHEIEMTSPASRDGTRCQPNGGAQDQKIRVPS